MGDLTSVEISSLSKGLSGGKFSSTELVKSFVSRIEKNKDLNAFLDLRTEAAIKEAADADAKLKSKNYQGDLLGIPIAIKDVISVYGTKTTCGSKILENYIAPYDATVISKLKAAGAILIGKTNMDEFAMGSSNENSAYGTVKNPWDKARVPGGSSGGSAAAVAARLCVGALGTDTGGSIRQPAALCGIVGIKPTYGRVSRYGLVAYASSLDQIGVFTGCVKDAAILLKVISGHDPLDSTSMDIPVPQWDKTLDAGVKGLRIGIPKEYFIQGLNTEVEKSVREALSKLESLGAKLVPISLPYSEAALAAYYIIAPAEASSNLARYDGVKFGHRASGVTDLKEMYQRSRAEGFGSEVKRRIMIGTYVLSTGYYDAYYLRAQKVRALIAQDFKKAFAEHCDLIACPTSPTTAFKIGEKSEDPLAMYLSDIFTIPVNLAGLPGMSVCCGFDSQKLPIGLQLIGKAFDEETIFRAAFAYESSTDWHMRPAKGIV